MCTYLKNQAGYTHKQLRGRSYVEIQKLFDKAYKQVSSFVPMYSEVIKDSEKKDDSSSKPAGGSRKKTVARKRTGAKLDEESAKRQKLKDVTKEAAAEYEKKKKELRLILKIINNDDSEVNYEPLSRKFSIVSWEYQWLGKMEAKDMKVYKLTKADGSSSYHGDIQAFLRRLDRQDLNDLYNLVQERFQDHPLEGRDLLLWGDLRMIFDPDEKDELWINQLD
ncbi:hypothetical protein Tco_1450527 [Tanacetum coccineum]